MTNKFVSCAVQLTDAFTTVLHTGLPQPALNRHEPATGTQDMIMLLPAG